MLNRSVIVLVAALLAVAPSWDAATVAAAQEDPWSRGTVGTGLLLRRLDGVKRVLMIGAHPDDEDTALLAALSRGMGVETAYLSLTRGEGGQNLLGSEMNEGLGLVRTGELLAARALDGGRQFFTRAFDFGYSKSAEETFRFWPREEILADVTWIVRTFRPQIIVSVFSGTPRDGHGHHQVAGIIAHEVFEVAGDSTRFPDQLLYGARPWSPDKLYRLTRRSPEEGTTGVETGTFDPLLGRSYFQIAMDSRSQHRSQDMGVAQPMGPRRSTVALVASRVGVEGPDQIFAGVDTTVLSLAEVLPEPDRGKAVQALKAYREALSDAREALGTLDPWEATPALGRALKALQGIREYVQVVGAPPFGRWPEGEMKRLLWDKIPLVEEAFLRSAGVVWDVRVDRDLLVPGQTADAVVEVWNGGPYRINAVGGVFLRRLGREVASQIQMMEVVEPGEVFRWEAEVEVDRRTEPPPGYYLVSPRDGEVYQWPDDRNFWAQPRNPEAFSGHLSVGVEGLGEVLVVKDARYRGVDKATGEYVKSVLVVPALSVSLDPPIMVWPGGTRASRDFTVTVRNQAGGDYTGSVSLEVPEGWRVDPISQPLSLSTDTGSESSVSFNVTAPVEQNGGAHSIHARAQTGDGREYGETVTLVDYPHIPQAALFTPAQSKVSVFPLEVEEQLRVGYVMGSGDSGAGAIQRMGIPVELLGPEIVQAGAFDGFDVVVLGIRAYETRPDLVASNDRLLDFARNGGTLIVQYNKYEFAGRDFAPFPVGMSRPHDRVSDETVPVRILAPEHPAFQFPNRITEEDFEGWTQERGLYFLGSWDSAFTPLLEMADPGEDLKRGGLMVAPLGEGLYVYTGLAFFRQFPEGVPGAYRLFANLLSLKGPGSDGN